MPVAVRREKITVGNLAGNNIGPDDNIYSEIIIPERPDLDFKQVDRFTEEVNDLFSNEGIHFLPLVLFTFFMFVALFFNCHLGSERF